MNLGYSDRQWRSIDKYLNALRQKEIEVHAILGNHEVMGRPVIGEKKFQQRFPSHNRFGYEQQINSIAVILLNSNWKTLTAKEDELQIKWYEETLDAFDADPDIHFTIVCCHHSPYTNSRIVKPSVEVREKFVPQYINS
ncbi:MAG TPA: metallophosphoesterase, partial [Flavisolibacter sp.]|nr:metallophosphoesterase [Flavisolibacter sp.]